MKIQYQSDHLVLFESALFRTTTSLIIGEDYLLLVDPNWLPIEIEFIENWITKIDSNKEKFLLFTHSDYDHIIGYGKFKDYKTIASKNFIDNPNKKTILNEINTFDDENYITRDYEIVYPKIEIAIASDGEQITIKGDRYIFYQAQGHNIDGIITYNKTKKILVVGDYLSNIEFPYIYDSVAKYKETLNKLETIIDKEEIDVLVTGHGDYTTQKQEMLDRIVVSRVYISELENCIQKGENFDLEKLFSKYHFPKIMTKFHDANLALYEKEYQHKKSI